ncbi:MAG: ATP-binding protein [Mariprofundus sp.]|nr:ATP-binding protein [Mariprofundus sp.]
MDIHSLLAAPESKTLELKRDLSSPKPILKTLVAFANSAGGTLIIGTNDGSRKASAWGFIERVQKETGAWRKYWQMNLSKR